MCVVCVCVCVCVRACVRACVCVLVPVLLFFSYNCNLFKHFIFHYIHIYLHVILMVCFKANFLLRILKFYVILLSAVSGPLAVFSSACVPIKAPVPSPTFNFCHSDGWVRLVSLSLQWFSLQNTHALNLSHVPQISQPLTHRVTSPCIAKNRKPKYSTMYMMAEFMTVELELSLTCSFQIKFCFKTN